MSVLPPVSSVPLAHEGSGPSSKKARVRPTNLNLQQIRLPSTHPTVSRTIRSPTTYLSPQLSHKPSLRTPPSASESEEENRRRKIHSLRNQAIAPIELNIQQLQAKVELLESKLIKTNTYLTIALCSVVALSVLFNYMNPVRMFPAY
ncbi:MAG: hypothetical protein JWO53_956 [Chlamydiia bacterium]|nr:hypothetical protein [Chlamydiia bacterium]